MIHGVFLIPIVAIVLGIGLAALGMWTDHKRKTLLLEAMHRERMAAIEKGVELPPVAFDASGNPTSPAAAAEKPVNPAKVLRSGVLLLALGIVLYLAIDGAGGQEGALFGLIPATLGLANLAYAAVLFNNERNAAEQKTRERLLP